jgi:hypothetical protein
MLLKHTRPQKVSILDVRKTGIYKQRMTDAIFCDFAEAEWDTVRQQIFQMKSIV